MKKSLTIILTSFLSTSIFATDLNSQFAKLESANNGRIGIAAINTANNAQITYRADEAFPFCSTSKVMTVAAILATSLTESGLLNKKIYYDANYVNKSGYSPISKNNLATGMTIAELSVAALDYSDNTAMNLLIDNLGGISKVNKFARSIGDTKFTLNRTEPSLNSAIPNDSRDTTTPNAMTQTLKRLLLTDSVLKISQQQQLITWLTNNTTGDNRIKAGIPKTWKIGDKTGTGDYGTTNDIAILYPTNGCAPIILSVYFTQYNKEAKPNEKIIQTATKLIIDNFSQSDSCLNTK